MNTYTQMIDSCMVMAGVYMLYCAIIGKGSLYKSDNIKKCMQEKYMKFIRWFCLYGGLTVVAAGLLDYLKIEPFAAIMYVIFSLIVISLIVINIRFAEPKKTYR